ncbi:MAG: hypothetical protein EF813_04260 [Methanosarcinales archaeon]|nr:MAG: hypothetical protein EF813_04260 [Methanosarcinales archaeon]
MSTKTAGIFVVGFMIGALMIYVGLSGLYNNVAAERDVAMAELQELNTACESLLEVCEQNQVELRQSESQLEELRLAYISLTESNVELASEYQAQSMVLQATVEVAQDQQTRLAKVDGLVQEAYDLGLADGAAQTDSTDQLWDIFNGIRWVVGV